MGSEEQGGNQIRLLVKNKRIVRKIIKFLEQSKSQVKTLISIWLMTKLHVLYTNKKKLL